MLPVAARCQQAEGSTSVQADAGALSQAEGLSRTLCPTLPFTGPPVVIFQDPFSRPQSACSPAASQLHTWGKEAAVPGCMGTVVAASGAPDEWEDLAEHQEMGQGVRQGCRPPAPSFPLVVQALD